MTLDIDPENTNEDVPESRKINETIKNPDIAYLAKLLDSDEFRKKVVEIRIQKQTNEMEELMGNIKKGPNKVIADAKNQAALESLGRSEEDLNTVRQELRGDWGKALQKVQEIKITIKEVEVKLPIDKATRILDEKAIEENQDRIKPQEDLVKQAEQKELQRFDQLKKDVLQRQDDEDFIEALSVWGKSPDSTGDRGPDSTGFNSGVIHYFGYREDKKKAGRFLKEDPEDFSVNGFIKISNKLKKYLLAEEWEDLEEVKNFAHFKDEKNQERLILNTDDGFICAFKGQEDDKLKIITVLPKSSKEKKNTNRYLNACKTEVEDTTNSKGRLNTLGSERETLAMDNETKTESRNWNLKNQRKN